MTAGACQTRAPQTQILPYATVGRQGEAVAPGGNTTVPLTGRRTGGPNHDAVRACAASAPAAASC
eukprot:7160389-Lingulodinium_polyedra.AAC.1